MAGTTANPASTTPSTNRPTGQPAPTPAANRQFSLARYLRDSRSELRKVNWPTREQTTNLTVVVCVVCVVIALFLGGIDYVFAQLVSALNQ